MPIRVKEVINIVAAPAGLANEQGGQVVVLALVRAQDPSQVEEAQYRVIGLTAQETNVNLIGLNLTDHYTAGWDDPTED